MTPEEKDLLLKDLCARLPYRFVEIPIPKSNVIYPMTGINIALGYVELAVYERILIEDARPYLRPMSSMTEGEMEELKKLSSGVVWRKDILHDIVLDIWYNTDSIDWLNKNMFDYSGLISMGLALEAPEDMYKDK